jgi:hypothetical protein
MARPKGSLNKMHGYPFNRVLECFGNVEMEFTTKNLPASFVIPSNFSDIPRPVFYIAYRLIKSGMAGDKAFPSFKAIDHTSDGERLQGRPVTVQVSNPQEAVDVTAAITQALAE